ncbi:MAG TPA: hypothetical protein ENH26_02205 [Candidatus Wolfebacteria bacterium]|nr:hypothetical protein [Candidatus Wolfebacteria bacterium]
MKFKKLVLYDLKSEPLEKEFIDKLNELAESVKIVFAEKEYSQSLKLSDIKDADALITRLFDYYDESLFTESNLKYIGAMHTDISHFNLDILSEKEITLTNIPGYATEAVAELTISALLNISRQTHNAMNFVKNGNWGFEKFLGWELKGKTLGIIGLGQIGNRVAEIAECFGMKVVHYTSSKKDKNFLELNNLLKQSDVVSLHCPLKDETECILNKSNLKLMKKGSVLLNSARSELVDLDVLYELCKQNRISAWFEAIEEKEIRDKFNQLDNIYLTPHFGWMTKEAQTRLKNLALNNVKSFLEGKTENKIE